MPPSSILEQPLSKPHQPDSGVMSSLADTDHLEAGQAHALEGRFDAALASLARATAADGNDHKAWDATAQVLLLAGEDEDPGAEKRAARAVVAARHAVSAAPAWAPAAVTLGRALLAARRWRQAAEALSAAVALDFGGDAELRAEAAADLEEAAELRDEAEAAATRGSQERTLSVAGRPLLTTAADDDGATAGSGPAVGVWECSVTLAMCLEWKGLDLRGKKVLELGAGLGVAGLGAALLGGDVVLTDLEDVVPRTTSRIARHRSLIDAAGGKAVALAYDWGKPLPADVAARGPFDVIVAADSVYRQDLLAPFLTALNALAEAETEVYVAHKRRRRDGVVDDFLENALRGKFADVVEAECHPLYEAPTLVVWHCRNALDEAMGGLALGGE